MAIITVSRGFYTGVGAAFAQELASCLEHPLLLREELARIVAGFGICEADLRREIQVGPAPVALPPQREALLTALQSALADICVSGNLIFHAEDGHLLLRTWPGALKICLFAPQAARVRVVANWQGLDFNTAGAYIRRVDRKRSRWTKFLYGTDWKNLTCYDLALNVEEVGLDVACAVAVNAARQPPYEVTDSSRRVLSDLAAACRAELAAVLKGREPTNTGIRTKAATAG